VAPSTQAIVECGDTPLYMTYLHRFIRKIKFAESEYERQVENHVPQRHCPAKRSHQKSIKLHMQQRHWTAEKVNDINKRVARPVHRFCRSGTYKTDKARFWPQGQILAAAFRFKSFKPLTIFPLRSEAAYRKLGHEMFN